MDKEKIWKRIDELEKKTKEKYIDQIPWQFIIECLSEDEQREYKKLCKKVGIRAFDDTDKKHRLRRLREKRLHRCK